MRKIMLGLLMTTALVFAPLANAEKPGPSYVGQGLGVLPGDNQSIGLGVNDAGSVVGRSSGPSGHRAVYWDRPTGVLYQLTTSGATGAAYAIAGRPGETAYAVGYEIAAGGSSRAVIWIAPPSSGPIFLDDSGSAAHGVNDSGVAVGRRSGIPAIWAPDGSNGYVATNIDLLPDQDFGIAEDINNDGIVVGYDLVDGLFPATLAFLQLANGSVIELSPAQGDAESMATAVSNVFTDSDTRFVYVAGSTRNANGVDRGVRWAVNVDTGAVVDQTVLSLQFASGVNGAGDMVGASMPRRRQSATMWRGGNYIELKPPHGGGNTAAHGMARSASSPTFAVGVTIMNRPQTLSQAVVWVVD